MTKNRSYAVKTNELNGRSITETLNILFDSFEDNEKVISQQETNGTIFITTEITSKKPKKKLLLERK